MTTCDGKHALPGCGGRCHLDASPRAVEDEVEQLTPIDAEPVCLPDWSKPSRAVCVGDGDDGAVCFEVGAHIADLIESVGTRRLSDLGLDAPEGISIFEGKYKGGGYNAYSGDYDDPDLVGDFRQPTDEEWAAIRKGECPWDADEWLLEPGQCCARDHNRDGNCDIHEAPGRRRPWPARRL